MYSSKIFLVFFLLTATIITIFSIPTSEKGDHVPQNKVIGRFLAEEASIRGGIRTCDKYPRVCGGRESPGPDCCKKKCVDVMRDRVNCGKCGRKCKYWEICCKGRCVNPSWDERNCGKCNHRCKKGSTCQYGMCSYA